MNKEVELIPMEDGKFYMRLEDVNKSIEVATFELQQENQSLKDRIEKAIEYIINNFDFDNDIEKLFEILKGDK